jgi:hypothetical protein
MLVNRENTQSQNVHRPILMFNYILLYGRPRSVPNVVVSLFECA